MNFLAHIDNKIWAMLPSELHKMRSSVAAHSAEIEKLASSRLSENTINALSGDAPRLKYGAVGSNGVAVINIKSVLFNPEGLIDELIAIYFGGTSTPQLMRDIDTVANDPFVSAVAFYCHSPGGDVFGINEAAKKIAALSEKKPTTAYIYGLGASACYALAAQCREIVSDEQALIGSIGVVANWADYTGFYEQMGIAYEEVTSEHAPYKRLDIRKTEERAVFMDEINGIETPLIKSVAKGRKVSVEKVRSDFGAGAVMAGHLAVKAGLADRTGNFDQVIKQLARKGKNSAVSAEKEGEFEMGFKDEFRAFAAKLGFEVNENQENPQTETDKPAAEAAAEKSATAETERLATEKQAAEQRAAQAEAQLADERAKNLEAEADAFINAEVEAGRAIPAEKEGLKSLYLQAARDDEKNPLSEGSRLENLKAIQGKRKAHRFNEELLSPGNLQILQGDESPDAKLDRAATKQAEEYVATVGGAKPKLEAVK